MQNEWIEVGWYLHREKEAIGEFALAIIVLFPLTWIKSR